MWAGIPPDHHVHKASVFQPFVAGIPVIRERTGTVIVKNYGSASDLRGNHEFHMGYIVGCFHTSTVTGIIFLSLKR